MTGQEALPGHDDPGAGFGAIKMIPVGLAEYFLHGRAAFCAAVKIWPFQNWPYPYVLE